MDRIKWGEVKVAYYPMENMLADFFTKPLQGAAFWHMRSHILNMPSTDNASEAHRSVLGKMQKLWDYNGKEIAMTTNRVVETRLGRMQKRNEEEKREKNENLLKMGQLIILILLACINAILSLRSTVTLWFLLLWCWYDVSIFVWPNFLISSKVAKIVCCANTRLFVYTVFIFSFPFKCSLANP